MSFNADGSKPHGNERFDQQNYVKAIGFFTQWIRVNPKADGCYFSPALLSNFNKQYNLAISDFTHVIKLFPDHVLAYKNHGVAHPHNND